MRPIAGQFGRAGRAGQSEHGWFAAALTLATLLALGGCADAAVAVTGGRDVDAVDFNGRSDATAVDLDGRNDATAVTDLAAASGETRDATSDGGVAVDALSDAAPIDALAPTDAAADAFPDGGPDVLDALDAAQDAGSDGVAARTGPLVLMTFNLRTITGGDGDDGWVYRRDLVARVVQDEAPDVLATQEGWRIQIRDMEDRLPGYAWDGISRQGNEIDEYCAVFWRTDRFAYVAGGTFWLSDTPDVPASYFSDAQCCPRIVTWVRLRTLAEGREIVVFGTHFDTTGADDVPARSAALLAERARTIAGDAPAVALGDFNEPPGSAAWRILTGAEERDGVTGFFADAWTELGLPEAGTFHGFDGVAGGSRIDWILHSADWTPTSAAIVRTEEDGRYPSDHFPVRATFDL